MAAVNLIKHPGVKKAYERELRDRLYWHARGTRSAWAPNGASVTATVGKKGYRRVRRVWRGSGWLCERFEVPVNGARPQVLFRAVFEDPDVSAIRDAAFCVYDNTEMLDRPTVAAHLRSLGRKRAVELLETFPVGQPMDPRSNEGRDWLDAMGRFPVARTLVAEMQATIRADEEGVEIMSAAHQARIMQKVIERRSASRSVVDEAITSPASDGAQVSEKRHRGNGGRYEVETL